MTGDLDITLADLTDAAQRRRVIDLVDAYARDPMGAGAPLSGDVRDRLERVLGDTPGLHVFVARQGETSVGMAFCQRTFSTFAAAPRLNVHDLTVVPEARGRGISKALLDAVTEHAGRLGCQAVTLEVTEQNARAQGVYASAGFKGLGADDRTFFLVKPL